jgi:hypothetical protein
MFGKAWVTPRRNKHKNFETEIILLFLVFYRLENEEEMNLAHSEKLGFVRTGTNQVVLLCAVCFPLVFFPTRHFLTGSGAGSARSTQMVHSGAGESPLEDSCHHPSESP